MKKIKFARENNTRMRILTPEEDARLLAHCSTTPASSGDCPAYRLSEVEAALADLGRRRFPAADDDSPGRVCQERGKPQCADERGLAFDAEGV